MYVMEDAKYLPPKFSYACKDLANYYNVFEKQSPMSAFSMTSSDKSILARDTFTPQTSITLNPIKEANIKRKINLNKSIEILKDLSVRRFRK